MGRTSVLLNMPDELKAQAVDAAGAAGVSTSAWIRGAMERRIADDATADPDLDRMALDAAYSVADGRGKRLMVRIAAAVAEAHQGA